MRNQKTASVRLTIPRSDRRALADRVSALEAFNVRIRALLLQKLGFDFDEEPAAELGEAAHG